MKREEIGTRGGMSGILCVAVALCSILLCTRSLITAGPINPPAGPVTSTYKTLTEIEPRIAIDATNTPGDAGSLFRITAKGSYYLTGNIEGVVGKHGIDIAASDVAIDLNGFTVSGPGSGDPRHGIWSSLSGARNVSIVNGRVARWGQSGVELRTNGSTACVVRGVHADANGGVGIHVGSDSIVRDCLATANGFFGILTLDNCSVAGCVAKGNVATGIGATNGCTILNCTASRNQQTGISTDSDSAVIDCVATSNRYGISANRSSTVSRCSAGHNSVHGILCNDGCVVRENTCSSNGSNGEGASIRVNGQSARIQGNTCIDSVIGIEITEAKNFVVANVCSNNVVSWSIVANNVVGPIVDRSSATSAAIFGNASAGFGTTDPSANFTY